MGVNGEALQLHTVYKSRNFYYKSRENPYQYCKSRENPYQVLQVTCVRLNVHGDTYILCTSCLVLPTVELKALVNTDCEGWWLSGCHSSVAEHS